MMKIFSNARLPVFALLFFQMLSELPAQGFGVVMDSVVAAPGQIVCVPVRARGFTKIIAYQYGMRWDSNVLSFHSTQNYNLPDLDHTSFSTFPNASNELLTVWASSSGMGVTRNDGEVLYEVCFTAIGQQGAFTLITFDASFPPGTGGNEAFNESLENVWDNSQLQPGFVSLTGMVSTKDGLQRTPALQMAISPNPAGANGTWMTFELDRPQNGTVRINDAFGQVVWSSPITGSTGENRIEIPASALTANGVYQVHLVLGRQSATSRLVVAH
jgi:hypothetical protein